MERKNIFDIVNEEKDFYREIHRLDMLLNDKNGVCIRVKNIMGYKDTYYSNIVFQRNNYFMD